MTERKTKFDSLDDFIKHYTHVCEECGEERLNYEMGESVCIYCESKETNDD